MMTPQQIEAEYNYYLFLARIQHTADYTTCQSIEHYTPLQRNYAAAEIAYFHDKGRLPHWATTIATVETLPDGSHLFIHHNPTPVD